MRVRRCAAAAGVLALGACDDPPTGVEKYRSPTTCSGSAATRAVSTASATWLRAHSPYVLEDSVTIGTLSIQPGVKVCVVQDAELVVLNDLSAIGTEADSILFLPAEPGGTWGGLFLGIEFDQYDGLPSHLRHVRLEGAGMSAQNPVLIDSSVVHGGNVVFTGTMRSVNVEGGGVHVPSYGRGVLENITVRDSPGTGVSVSRRAGITLNGVRIEGSRGIGFHAHSLIGGAANVVIDGLLRITEGASYPAYGPIDMVDALFQGEGSVDSLTGNALDTLLLGGNGINSRPMTITARLPWRIGDGGGCLCGGLGTIHMEAGASLVVEADVGPGFTIAQLSIAGTADRRVTIVGISSAVGSPVPFNVGRSSVLTGLRLENVRLQLLGRADVQDAVGTLSSIEAMVPGSTLRDVRLREAHWPAVVLGPATVLERSTIVGSRQDGVVVRGENVRLSDCIIGGNDGYGVHIESGAAVITGCSLLSNRREALLNSSATRVDARNNWWGSRDGPGAPGAGSIAGPVDYMPFLSQPPETATNAASVEITRVVPVTTADTMTALAEVRDANDAVLPFEVVLWSVDDPSVAEIFSDGLLQGLAPGVVRVTATVLGDTTIRATASLQVLPGAQAHDWERHEPGGLITSVAAADDVVFVGAFSGTVHRYDGSSWTSHVFEEGKGSVTHVWARNASDVYALWMDSDPDSGTIYAHLYHYDGASWTFIRQFDGFVQALSGSGASDVYVGGVFGLWHYDGAEWHYLFSQSVTSVFARSPSDLFFSGQIGSDYGVGYFNGVAISDLGGPAGIRLWGTDDALFGAGGSGHQLFQYRPPSGWIAVASTTPLRVGWVAGNTATDVFALAVDGALGYYDGAWAYPVWMEGFTPEMPVWIDVDEDHVYIAEYTSIYIGVRRN